jgi:methyl-accepting chemotaxis protein
MTPEFWIQLCSLLLGGAGALGTVYGVLNGRISKAANKLHERVDRAEAATAEVRRDYVRRDDLKDDMHGLSTAIDRVEQSLKADVGRIERGQENVAGKVDGFAQSLLPAIAELAKAALTVGERK